jgi:hypothetical protein
VTTRTAWCVKCDGPVECNEDGCIKCAHSRERDRLARMNAPLRASCAICAGTYGLHRDQLEPGGPVFTVCANCDGTEEAGEWATKPSKHKFRPRGLTGRGPATAYKPIDEIDRDLKVRILRGVRHFDWITSADLGVAIGIELTKRGRNDAYNMAVCWLNREGFLERVKHLVFEYRITDKGRAHLDNEIRRPLGLDRWDTRMRHAGRNKRGAA